MIRAFLALREIHNAFGQATGILEDYIGRPICLPNCGLCCSTHTPNYMTIEAINAVSSLTGRGGLSAIVSIAEGWLLERHNAATLYEGMPVGIVSPKLREEWQALSRSQCPFLGSDKRCLIYEERPLACRASGVTRDLAEICPRPLGRDEHVTQRMIIPGGDIRKDIEFLREEWRARNPTWIISGFTPSLLYRCAESEKFKTLVKDNKIASAKIIGIEYETSLMWQDQVDALRGGVFPDLVAAMRE